MRIVGRYRVEFGRAMGYGRARAILRLLLGNSTHEK